MDELNWRLLRKIAGKMPFQHFFVKKNVSVVNFSAFLNVHMGPAKLN